MSHAAFDLDARLASLRSHERRAHPRDEIRSNLWLIDATTGTVLRAHCVDVSAGGMRLRVPVGYGVQTGQRYELCSHVPRRNAQPPPGYARRRWATVQRAQIVSGGDLANWDVGVAFDVPSREQRDFGFARQVLTAMPS